MKRAFKVKLKTFFLVPIVISFRHTKQTSKNVAVATFKSTVNKHLLSLGSILSTYLNNFHILLFLGAPCLTVAVQPRVK